MNAHPSPTAPPPFPYPTPGPLAQVADPAVSRAKFEGELARFRAGEPLQRRRGVLLLRADFPVVVLAFAAPQVLHAPVVFGARLDFTDYDHSPPSLRLVNPFTEELYPTVSDVPTPLFRRVVSPNPDGAVIAQAVPLVMAHEGHPPFVCMKGIREYHEHPAHTGDAWLRYRGTDRGTLADIVDQLHDHGIAPLTGYHIGFSGIQVTLQLNGDLLPGDPPPAQPDAQPAAA